MTEISQKTTDNLKQIINDSDVAIAAIETLIANNLTYLQQRIKNDNADGQDLANTAINALEILRRLARREHNKDARILGENEIA